MATTKDVQVLARYIHKTDGKPNGIVTYCVKSSNGKDFYYTTIINGEATGCSCPSRSKNGCYHKNQLAAREQESRTAAHEAVLCEGIVASRLAASNLPLWVGAMVAKGVLKVPALPIAKALPVELQGYKKTAVSADTSVLNGAQQTAGLLMALPSRKARAS